MNQGEPKVLDLSISDQTRETFGTLLDDQDQVIPYHPFSISKFSMGVIAKSGLNAIKDLYLDSIIGKLRLRVLSVGNDGVPDGTQRYMLMNVDMEQDLEKVFDAATGAAQHQGKSILSARFQTAPPCVFKGKTFGSSNPYVFKTINASKSGILIMSMQKSPPFRTGTLVEYSMEPNGEWLTKPINGMAKVARQWTHQVKVASTTTYFGLELKEFLDDGEALWQQSIHELEKVCIEQHIVETQRDSA